MKLAILLAFEFAAGLALAQTPDPLAIHGTVAELGPGAASTLAVAGAEVTLSEFLPVDGLITRVPAATVYTDTQGSFQFHPDHAGAFYIEARKAGYTGFSLDEGEFAGAPVTLTAGQAAPPVKLNLTRRGELTGRVVDEDGQPVAGLRITVQPGGDAADARFLEVPAVTGPDGYFTALRLRTGPYVVRISPRSGDLETLVPKYSEDDLKIVDEDLESAFWPGGFSSPSASIPVSGGATASIGTIKVRNAPYYRVHVSVPAADCAPGEMWDFSVRDSGGEQLGTYYKGYGDLPCSKDFLVRNLKAGSYWFRLSSEHGWALVPVQVSNKNLEVALTLTPDATVSGRFVAAEGATLPPLNEVSIMDAAFAGFGMARVPTKSDGTFDMRNLKGPRHRIVVEFRTRQYYVKEIRFNQAPAPGGFLDVSPGADQQAEVVIDDKPGVITGSVMDGDKPAPALVRLVTLPITPDQIYLAATANQDGKFSFLGLTPGEYRAVALPAQAAGTRSVDNDALIQLAARAETITVERGGTQTVSLKLVDPSH